MMKYNEFLNDDKPLSQFSISEIEALASTNSEKIISTTSNGTNSFSVKILENYGCLANRKNAIYFTKVIWNDHVCFDLRHWSEDFTIPKKGIVIESSELSRFPSVHQLETSTPPKAIYKSPSTDVYIFRTIVEISTISKKGETWRKELNVVDWGTGAKIDLRKWTDGYTRCSKGVLMTLQEYQSLYKLISSLIKS